MCAWGICRALAPPLEQRGGYLSWRDGLRFGFPFSRRATPPRSRAPLRHCSISCRTCPAVPAPTHRPRASRHHAAAAATGARRCKTFLLVLSLAKSWFATRPRSSRAQLAPDPAEKTTRGPAPAPGAWRQRAPASDIRQNICKRTAGVLDTSPQPTLVHHPLGPLLPAAIRFFGACCSTDPRWQGQTGVDGCVGRCEEAVWPDCANCGRSNMLLASRHDNLTKRR